MKIIYASKREEILVDDDNYEELNKYKWRITENGYAIRHTPRNNYKRGSVLMHREIMGTPKGYFVDHINHQKTDNRKCNLRNVTKSENHMNVGKIATNTSGVTGVSWSSTAKKWQASIVVNKKSIHLGLFANINEAASARKEAEIKYFGEFRYRGSEDEKQHVAK